MWHVLAICWFPIELAIRRVFCGFSIWINPSCCRCELRYRNDYKVMSERCSNSHTVQGAEKTPKDRILHQKPTRLAKLSPFFSPMRPVSTGKLPHSNCAHLMILVHTWVETKTRQQCKDLMYPWGKYIFQLCPLQVPRKPKQHFWQIPKDPCMVYIPTFGLRSKFMGLNVGKYSSPMEHLGIGNWVGSYCKVPPRISWRWNYIPCRNLKMYTLED